MKNILITGGLGYIGGRIGAYLKEKHPKLNIILTAINDFIPAWSDKFTVINMDLRDNASIERCFKNKPIDLIIHLAAVNEIKSIKSPELAIAVNSQGTYKLLKIAKDNRVERFIYFSTFHVYDEPTSSKITEDSPTRPYHPYAITHRAAEDYVNYFQHHRGMKTLIFRLSNSYGYPANKEVNRWSLVVSDLCRQVVTQGRITLKSSGRQYRDFIALADVARAIEYFIFTVPDKWGDGLYNLGGNQCVSILQLAKKIVQIYADKYGKTAEIVTTKSDDNVKYEPFSYNIDKLLATGFTLAGDMETEMIKTMQICEEFLNE